MSKNQRLTVPLVRDHKGGALRPAPWDDVEATWCEGARVNQFGPDALTAGLRAFVTGRLGSVLHVPDDLLSKIREQDDDSIEQPGDAPPDAPAP